MSTRNVRTLVAGAALVLLVPGCGGAGDEPDDDPSATASRSASASAPPATAAGWVEGLPVGPPPRIGYVVGHTYHSADGRMVRLPRRFGITSIVPLGDGYLVTSDQHFEGSTGVYLLDSRGRIDTSVGRTGHQPGGATVASYPVLDANGSTVHWLTFTPPETGLDLPTLVHTGDVATGAIMAAEIDLSPTFLTSVTGVVGDATVIRSGWGGHGEVWVRTGGGELTRAPALDRAGLISPRSRLVAMSLGDDATGMLDFDTREVLWRQPHSSPMAFNPSGRQLLIADRQQISVVHARTGSARYDIAPPPYRQKQWYSEQLAWEDERHLLAGIELQHRAAVVRIDVRTGEVELAVDWTPTDGPFAIAFETRP